MSPIADAWSEFERMVLPSGVSDLQREQMRKAEAYASEMRDNARVGQA